ncbi:MAG TPA: PQQ-binding-like beta-propeller repeat protein [Ktedonobacteraceae bacterium]
MPTPDPEYRAEDETKIEITDLDIPLASGKLPGRFTRRSRIASSRARVWIGIATVAGFVLLGAAVLVNVAPQPKVARPDAPAQTNYPVALSVVDGICYTTAPNGIVTALRVSDGVLLWRHTGKAAEETATVTGGIIYLVPLLPNKGSTPTVTIEALRARDGSPLWSHSFPHDALNEFQLTVVNGVVYIRSVEKSITALRASDGSLLWSYTAQTPFVSTVVEGTVYTLTQDGHLTALSASSGSVLWTHTSLTPTRPSPAIVANGLVFLSLRDSGIDALRAETGALLWRYTPRDSTLTLLSPPRVANGSVYILTQDGYLTALRASSGSTVWRVGFHRTSPLFFLAATGGEIYVETLDGSVDALSENSGSALWHYQSRGGGPTAMTAVQGAIYLASATTGVNVFRSITVLGANNGLVLWLYNPHTPAIQVTPVLANNLVLIPLQDGSIDALDASSGSLRWHRAMNS